MHSVMLYGNETCPVKNDAHAILDQRIGFMLSNLRINYDWTPWGNVQKMYNYLEQKIKFADVGSLACWQPRKNKEVKRR